MGTPSKTDIASRLREIAGVVVKDLVHFGPALCRMPAAGPGAAAWIYLKNRYETLEADPLGNGVACQWTWSSDLHACRVFPSWGRRLMQVSLAQWPIRLADAPLTTAGRKVSFVFAHSGTDRIPHLLRVIRSIFAQCGVCVEVVVVDLSAEPIGAQLPSEVNYIHVATDHLSRGWRKSWAFNIAARQASGEFLVFQDGDVCVPAQYGAELLKVFDRGYDSASIHRFLYYLDEPTTRAAFDTDEIPARATPLRVLQNFKGGTIAVRRSAFFEIGGFDEAFVGWGGEDDEFYDRCQSRRHCRFGYLPFVHLWHKPQVDRVKPENINVGMVLPERLAMPAETRIAELRDRRWGDLDGPDPLQSYQEKIVAASSLRSRTAPQVERVG